MPELDRFRPYAEEAVAGAAGILVGSPHIAERLRLAVDDPETNAKVRLGPPGVDIDLFAPIPRSERDALESLAQALRRRRLEPAAVAAGAGRLSGTATPRPRPRRSTGTPRPAARGSSSSAS